jgi:uncharacterized protein DUF4386
MGSPKTLARIAGILYLLLFGAAFNEGYVLPHVVKSGDAAATADSIRASATLFRLGIFGDLTAGGLWLLLAMALYLLLRDVNRLAAAAMVTFAAVGAGIQIQNQLNQYTALTVATGTGYPHALGTSGSDALTLLFVDMQHNGYVIDALFFGLWLLPLGYLTVRSGYFPKVLGVLVVAAGCGYLAYLCSVFLTPGISDRIWQFATVPAAAAGELTFLLWLLIKGIRVPPPSPSLPT